MSHYFSAELFKIASAKARVLEGIIGAAPGAAAGAGIAYMSGKDRRFGEEEAAGATAGAIAGTALSVGTSAVLRSRAAAAMLKDFRSSKVVVDGAADLSNVTVGERPSWIRSQLSDLNTDQARERFTEAALRASGADPEVLAKSVATNEGRIANLLGRRDRVNPVAVSVSSGMESARRGLRETRALNQQALDAYEDATDDWRAIRGWGPLHPNFSAARDAYRKARKDTLSARQMLDAYRADLDFYTKRQKRVKSVRDAISAELKSREADVRKALNTQKSAKNQGTANLKAEIERLRGLQASTDDLILKRRAEINKSVNDKLFGRF